MKKSIKVHPKRRGRPATGKDPLISARVPAEIVASIEAWGAAKAVTRSAAIRRLVEIGLQAKRSAKATTRSTPNKFRAAELAAKAIDKMGDPAASADERDHRRRRLTKGPPEFREDRVDLPKVKK
jgi:hypothetical protein